MLDQCSHQISKKSSSMSSCPPQFSECHDGKKYERVVQSKLGLRIFHHRGAAGHVRRPPLATPTYIELGDIGSNNNLLRTRDSSRDKSFQIKKIESILPKQVWSVLF